MSDYDRRVSEAKERVLKAICDTQPHPHGIAQTVDELNAAWDALTDALVRQRKVMSETIDHLHHRLAEAEKRDHRRLAVDPRPQGQLGTELLHWQRGQ